MMFNLPSYKTLILQHMQNKCMRYILKCDKYIPIALMLNTFWYIRITIYKINISIMPCDLWNNKKLKVEYCKSIKSHKTLFYEGLVTIVVCSAGVHYIFNEVCYFVHL